ncbi:aminotransferase class I/II-fold pyridoxal phosphate-dependent enzyme [Propionimicrobium sp. PCR01-08-3]|uniref:MalY/PatB family protein n=1 Tax=Propionimicrobium sp. PCR01-08-3 TaxID=3052086 RepID=UPI00255CD8E5|nr:aminotransferase class I/II-fold pyridoxal phosphate-dependent enzyme [Propionimicrobium sp. PCR01-08-3]WIY82321.1 aminotransferase class I/II-fold pyridoxal phosphate-dependent enzyme [Propionimicrobium sp. PCR01-08-3]
MSEFADRIDALTPDDLRTAGSLKWTTYPGAIGAWIAEMDFGIAPKIQDALGDMVARQQTGYAPMAMRTELKQATSEFLAARYGWQVDWPKVQWLPDVLTGLGIVMTHWLPAHSKIIVPTPCYFPFVDMPVTFGHERVDLPMLRGNDEWTMDFDALDREFAAGAKLLILCNPHNPIGKVFDRAELEAICEIVERHHGMVFSDEIHAPLVYPASNPHIPYASINETAAAHTVTAMSASKSFNIAGLKCAQMVLTNPTQQRFYETQGHGLPYESSPLGMAANIAAFREGTPWLGEVLDYLDGNRAVVTKMVSELLPGVKYIEPQASFLAWLDFRPVGLDDPQRHFLEAGVAVTAGAECGEIGRGQVRFNFAMPRPVLIEAIEKMADALPK